MLERGVADAITFPWGSLGLFGIDKVVSYHIDAPLYVTPSLGAEQDKIASRCRRRRRRSSTITAPPNGPKVAGPWADFEPPAAKISSTTGHEMVKLAPDQLDQWRRARPWAPRQEGRAVGRSVKTSAPIKEAAVLDALHQSLVKYKSAL